MPKIKLLSDKEILKIAAGEVVVRPANVVKELLENALDSGAKNIILRISKAGKKKIIIEDDGCGMDEDDAILSVVPHATSKISSVDDLWDLSSFGFRGEALASIAAVSNLEIITAIDPSSGLHLVFEQGKVISSLKKSRRSQGTTIVVDNLFVNLPVRQKFLKSDEVESNQIWQSFLAVALIYPSVGFQFFEDEKLICNAAATDDPLDRIAQLFDYHLAKNLIPISIQESDFSIDGFVSNLQINRYNRNQMYLFINNRSFKDAKINNAICNGYNGSLLDQKYPVSFVNIKIKPHLIDVNIHPSKEEILIQPYSKVLNACKEAVKKSLEESVLASNNSVFASPVVSPSNPSEAVDKISYSWTPDNFATKNSLFSYDTDFKQKQDLKNINNIVNFDREITPAFVEPKNNIPNFQSTISVSKNFKILGQIFRTYVLVELDDKLCLVDQHAASERIIYEEMKDNFENISHFYLVTPVSVVLSQENVSLLDSLREVFLSFGISFNSKETFIEVVSFPPKFNFDNISTFFKEVIEIIACGSDLSVEIIRKRLFEHVHSHLACKTAIKANDILTLDVMNNLLQKLLTVSNRYQCIHGRPTMFEISKKELDTHFKRL